MHDPKFEQEVQRKMHDLEFVPSESVWTGIREGIVPRERRRTVAVWWLFPGLLLLTGAIVMYRHSASTNDVAAKAVRSAGEKVDPSKKDGTESEVAKNQPADPAARAAVDQGAAIHGAAIHGAADLRTGKERKTDEEKTYAGTSDGTRIDERTTDGARTNERTSAGARIDERTTDEGTNDKGTMAMGTSQQKAAASQRAMLARFHPGLIAATTGRRGVSAPSLNRPVNPAVDGIGSPKHPWYIGFAAGGGATSIYSSGGNPLVAGASTHGSYTAAAFNISGGTPGIPQTLPLASRTNPAASKRNVTGVQPNYSYFAGIYGEKRLSGRWSFDIGLNLHYNSVRFQTATQVNTYAPSSASLLVASPVTYAANGTNSYITGTEQTYVNSYYFLEIPAAVQWRLNHNRSLPLFWRGGAVLSYLMSSNGFYYDNSTGLYKNDNGEVRRLQASVNTGLVVGLPVRGVQIQAGPVVQYALTSMLRAGTGGGHMVYGGMRVALMR